jgi:hypothetical protein
MPIEITPTIFWGVVVWFTILIVIVIGLLGGYLPQAMKTSGFHGNDPNNIRQYQLVGDMSQNDRQAQAVARRSSGMTGTRDIPVFFQDYDYDMSLSKTGLSNSREGLVGESEDGKKFKLG